MSCGFYRTDKERNKNKKRGKENMGCELTLFSNAEEAWFWFMQANKARQDGAKSRVEFGAVIRPCEPSDILKILERLRRHRRLDMNHFRVMRYYGERMVAPDRCRVKESSAAKIWNEAMSVLGEVLIAKNIIWPSLEAEIINFQSKVEEMSQW